MGVKSLWKLLVPVGRPVMLETMESHVMAIDSSIWLYQFQATMRDNDGRALSNAHILGFLRRIAKLLFYGIKPVFVFDGGAPALKKTTLTERRKKKSGAALSHVRLAEKLLAAQMRREALHQARGSPKTSKGKGKAPAGPVVLDDNTVYLEDIDSSTPKAPPRPAGTESLSASPSKPKFHDHDPYRLPDIDLEAAVAKATRAAVPDPRLATEDELREFIEDMRPEDFDVTSPAFRELPTEVQYEIVGDLRLKSRQTSYARLQHMLKTASTPLDFSKQQIQNLRQRNTLTQQLLSTTDTIGKANITIPVRVASERNREYLLIKNEGHDGGWILGIRDDGTREKPIEIDQDEKKDISEGDDSDEDMEEVPIPQAGVPDSDLQEYQRTMSLAAIANRNGPKKSKTAPVNVMSQPLFEDDNDMVLIDDDHDEGLAFAIQESIDGGKGVILEDEDDGQLALAIQESIDQANASNATQQTPMRPSRPMQVNAVASSSKTVDTAPRRLSDSVSQYPLYDEDTFVRGNRLETALSIANAGFVRTPTKPRPASFMFGEPALLQVKTPSPAPPKASPSPLSRPAVQPPERRSDNGKTDSFPKPRSEVTMSPFGKPVLLQPQTPPPSTPSFARRAKASDLSDEDKEEVLPTFEVFASAQPELTAAIISPRSQRANVVTPPTTPPRLKSPVTSVVEAVVDNGTVSDREPSSLVVADEATSMPDSQTPAERIDVEPIALGNSFEDMTRTESVPLEPSSRNDAVELEDGKDLEDDEPISGWSRSPSPIVGVEHPQPRISSPVPDDWDAAQEMDADVEEDEFARFMSQVKGKDLEEIQQEIDEEIKVLNQQKKAAMRDSEDINQQMISQVMMMLSLFGIPYITAPMEAEAQCAELVHLGLVNGVITDDSDVFLFGSARVFKNMFNQAKTVECFLLADLDRELGLDRDTLIRLAYLLGSDYVDGLPGVGPVVAMELLDEFPGEDGLYKFKDWWVKVQSGKDKPEDNKSKFRKRFKKNFKELYLPPEWPNPAVRDAYYHPSVDSSDEPFKWGLPDLDALREYLYAELSWSSEKTDELLLPIIQKMRKRGQANLNGFFDITGSGTIAPRQRQAYASKRLQQVVSDYRNKRKQGHASKSPAASAQGAQSQSSEEDEAPVKKKTKTGKTKTGQAPKRGTGRGRGRGAKRGSSRKKVLSEDEAEFKGGTLGPESVPEFAPQLRPRPKPAYKEVAAPDAESMDEE
ncbi:hypothetical protein DFH06DRAFT_1265749 [Mycena polygramma]|nr:hypothetical protein DFH06DRAFT_1265749 [Mycena polygramma]